MARVYMITEEEMQSLIERLELAKLRGQADLPDRDPKKILLDDIHRSFHFHVVRWTQDMGYRGHRS